MCIEKEKSRQQLALDAAIQTKYKLDHPKITQCPQTLKSKG